jgi:hypothetical protein
MTSQSNAPSLDLWRCLYAAADRFFKESPWEVLGSEMLFGVEDPATKQIGWCCVLGGGGMEFGLAVYRGPTGFSAWIAMMNRVDHDDLLALLDSVNLTFDHSDFLESRDLDVVRALRIGSAYRSAQKWPRFRAYLPARHPWYLQTGEALFLKAAIEQTLVVSRLAAKNPRVLVAGAPDKFLIRVQSNESGAPEWRTEYRVAHPRVEPARAPLQIDAAILTNIRAKPVEKRLTIDVELSIMSTPICDSEPPWHPWLMLVVDAKTDFVFRTDCMPKDADPVIEGSRQLISVLGGLQHRPCTIRVRQDNLHRYLKKTCADLGIKLQRATSLPAIQKVKDSLRDFMRWDRTILES